MRPFEIPRKNQLNHEGQLIIDNLEKNMSKVPALYKVMTYSLPALKGFLAFEETLSHGVFTEKEREAIALVVSQVNDCPYCLAWHTAQAIKMGFTADEIRSIRQGEVSDRKLNAIIKLVRGIVESQGHPEDSLQIRLYMAGYQEAGAIELVALVSLWIFTSYLYALTPVPIDFPQVEQLC